MPEETPVLSLILGHLTQSRYRSTYKRYPLTLERPGKGAKVVKMKCPMCSARLKIRVLSPAAALHRRLLSLAGFAVIISYVIAVYATVSPGEITILQGVFVTLAFLGIFVGIFLLIRAFMSEAFLAANIVGDSSDPMGTGISHRFLKEETDTQTEDSEAARQSGGG